MARNPARIYSAELEGIKAKLIEIEVDLNVGLHAFTIVGLADKALNEAKERVNSALKNSGIKAPNRENRKITVNLAPADVKKAGTHYDMAIALGYLCVTEQIKEFDAKNKMFIGELALDGRLRPINGALNIAEMAAKRGFEYLILPAMSANEAAIIKNIKVIPLETLQDAIDFLEGKKEISPKEFDQSVTEEGIVTDLSEIKSQDNAKRALMIAAAGSHNLLMIGPPGVGKSLLAQALVGILPKLRLEEAIEITKIYSAAGLAPKGLLRQRPFRAPHQTASIVAVIGGGTDPKPGEISLAHRGILFLDEMPEFQKNILEALRQPMESGTVHIARARSNIVLPAKFTLVAAMNPCPCGYYGDAEKECRCTAHEVIKYQKKISGPLLDRIDLQIKIQRVKIAELRERQDAKAVSASVKERIERARDAQAERFSSQRINVNSEMSSRQTEETVRLGSDAEKFMRTLDKSHLSPRGYYRMLKTARTIADLEAEEGVTTDHLAEAFSYRLREEV